MKNFYLLIFSAAVVVSLAAQGLPKNDPLAKTILDAVSLKFKSYKTTKATFVYKVESAANKVLSSKNGTIYMKGVKYRVSFIGQEIFCDGINVWSFDKAANEVSITQFDPESNTLTPQKLFTNFYDDDFLYKLNSEKKQGTKIIQEIELTPTDKSKSFHKVYIYIDKIRKTITGTKVMEKTGNRYIYSVTALTTNSVIADSQFIFDAKKYPGVEVIDLR
ncbi:MAG: outer membrane lipoprotein carrier protein LolA [Chitinophagaceae bacterium]|nr:MAG: outer membrane lipoprotein carrier protein LolA [Chitinophagaceae bacterium]